MCQRVHGQSARLHYAGRVVNPEARRADYAAYLNTHDTTMLDAVRVANAHVIELEQHLLSELAKAGLKRQKRTKLFEGDIVAAKGIFADIADCYGTVVEVPKNWTPPAPFVP